MRKLIFLMIVLGLAIVSKAQFQMIKLEKVELIKNSKLVVGLTGDKDIDDAMIAAVKEFWTIGEIGEAMPLEEALDRARDDNSITVIKTGTVVVRSVTHSTNYWDYRYVTKAKALQLYNGQKKAVFGQYIPEFNSEITSEILRFGVAAMNYFLTQMQENQIGITKLKSHYKTYSPQLKNATLLIPEGWTDKKTTPESLKELYGGKAYIVSYTMWRKAILNREEGIAYNMICYVPMGGGYVYQHFLMDAKTGNVYAIVQSKVAVGLNTKVSKQVSLTKGNSGYVNKKILEKYNDVLEGKW